MRNSSALHTAVLGLLLIVASAASFGDCATRPTLVLEASQATTPGTPVFVPLGFDNGGHGISAMAFSIDLDPELAFDDTDADANGIPDSVRLPAGRPAVTIIDYDPIDTDGELDVLFADLAGAPLPEGILLELAPSQRGYVSQWIRFSDDPPASFGNAQGQDVPGLTFVVPGGLVFADGFECGDTNAWSATAP